MTAPQHAPNLYFPVANDELVVGGMGLATLAARVGRTPFYVYDRAVLQRRIDELRAALPRAIDLHSAIKANPMPELVRFMAERVDGLDVASAGELRVALASGLSPREVSFAGPAKREEELAAAVAAGILINVESE